MYKKSLENYRVEYFVSDESFINYHFRINEKDRIFWEQWLIKNPAKRSIAREAGEMIQSLSLTLNENEFNNEFEKIKIAINKEEPKPVTRLLSWNKNSQPRRRLKRSVSYLIIVFLIVAATGIIYLLTSHAENKISQLNETVNSSGKTMTFILSDSTVVTLSPNSTLKYPSSFRGTNRQVYLVGDAGFHVKRNEHFPFKVHSGNIVTTVLGTIFNIKKNGDSAIVVELLTGKLKVETEDTTAASPILLNPDEKAIYVFHDKHLYKNSLLAKADANFRKSSFEEIAASIKNIFGITLINNSDKKNWRFTGQFKNTTAREIIENICLIKDLKSKMIGDTIFINN
jgi:transmembrane sensor